MDVADRILEHVCEGCDQDPIKCLYQGYCEYDGPDDDTNIKVPIDER